MDHTRNSRSAAEVFRHLMFVLIGSVILLIASYLLVDRYQFLAAAQAAEGHVIKLNAGGSHPQIEFTTTAGERIEYAQGGLIFGYEEGEPVRVLYLAERPLSSAVVDNVGALWGMNVFLLIMGATFVGVSILQLFKRRPGAPHRA